MRKNLIRRRILKQIQTHIKYVNHMAPFPIIDTYYIDLLRTKLDMDNINYDNEPVLCCSNCKSLYIIEENGLSHCVKCRTSGVELETFICIDDYLSEYGDIWNIKNKKDEQETGSN